MSAYKPVKYVIFDMDGLLLSTEILYTQIFHEIFGRYGKPFPIELQQKILGTVPKDRENIFIDYYKLNITPEELTEEIHMAARQKMPHCELMPGVERLVNHLKKHNIPIAIGTSSDQELYEIKTKKHRALFDKFHHAVTAGSDPEVKHGKPAPDVFLVCAARFPQKPRPEECLVFEDAPTGVQAAASAGMQVVMVPDPTLPEEKRKLATKVIPSLLDFKPEEFGLPKFED